MSRIAGRSIVAWVVVLAVLASAAQAGSKKTDRDAGFLDARQFHVGPALALVPNGSTARQIVDCWQINAGRWNGQDLGGLALVLVREISEDGSESRVNVYISERATAAQREALLGALAASYPALFPLVRSAGMQLEPAVIQLEELEGQTYVLHLGLIA